MAEKITVQFIYSPRFVYGWLKESELAGLDVFGTLARFEEKVRDTLGVWAFVKEIVCRIDNDDPNLAFRIEPVDQIRRDIVRIMNRQILEDMGINRHWLKYESPELHARALAYTGNINLRVTLAQDMADCYNISSKEARDLIQKAKELIDGPN